MQRISNLPEHERFLIERLEPRRLLSVATGADGGAAPDQSDDAGVADASWLSAPEPFIYVVGSRDGKLSGCLAWFVGDPGTTINSYSATVDWGDGTQTDVPLKILEGHSFSIEGSHNYAQKGEYFVCVNIFGKDHPFSYEDGFDYVSANDFEFFAYADPLTPLQSPGLISYQWFDENAASDDGFQVVGSFIDSDYQGGPTSHYSVTIDWGDGAQDVVQTDNGQSQLVDIDGYHRYAAPGIYNVSYTAIRDDGVSISDSGTMEVVDIATLPPDLYLGFGDIPVGAVYAPISAESQSVPAPDQKADVTFAQLDPMTSSIAAEVFKADRALKELDSGPVDVLA